jgi:catechol-2,3-dioxygenase
MKNCPRLRHAAIHVSDVEAAADFYCNFLGLKVVGRSSTPITGDMVLLSGDRTEEDHELQLISKREGEHVAFRVDSLSELKSRYHDAKSKGIPVLMTANHGTAVGFFVRDPSGRAVELYWSTGRTDIEASLRPIDLELSDEEILAQVRAVSTTSSDHS